MKPEGKFFKRDTTNAKSENNNYTPSSQPTVEFAFRQMDAYPDVRIPQLIHWINTHPNEAPLNYGEIEIGFFRDHALLMALRNEPSIQKNIQNLVREQLRILSPSAYKEGMFWVKLGLLAETYADQVDGLSFDKAFINELQEYLQKQIERQHHSRNKDESVLQALHYRFALLKSYPEDQIEDFLVHKTCAQFYGLNLTISKDLLLNDFIYRHEAQLDLFEAALKDPQKRERIGQEILKQLGITAGNGSWRSAYYPELRWQGNGTEILIDLSTGSVTRNGVLLGKSVMPNWVDQDVLKRIGIDPKSQITVNSANNKIIARDGSFEIKKNFNGKAIYFKKHPFSGDELLKMDNESLKANTSFNVSSLLKERTLWLGKDKGYVVDDGTQTVAATLDRPSGIITHDGLRLMSQQGLPQKAKEFLSQSMDMSQVLFWGTAAGLNQSELTAIEIRDLGGLTFKKGKEAHIWESMQHKGFALSQKQGCLEGIAMPGAFQLESLSDPSVKKIILPAKQLSLIHPFDRADYFRTGSPIVAQPGYFEYDVIDKTGHLYSDDPLSLLYLTYVYQMIGDYTLANHYLNQLPQAHN